MRRYTNWLVCLGIAMGFVIWEEKINMNEIWSIILYFAACISCFVLGWLSNNDHHK
jgi:hypothetical protein